jgi:hypothetical protein
MHAKLLSGNLKVKDQQEIPRYRWMDNIKINLLYIHDVVSISFSSRDYKLLETDFDEIVHQDMV